MSETRYTPGPWGYEAGPIGEPGELDDQAYLIFDNTAAGEVIAAVYAPVSNGEVLANACLIAAAPALFEALERAVSDPNNEGWMIDAAAALAEARGET